MPVTNSDIASLCWTLPEFSSKEDISTFIKSVDNLLTFLGTQELTEPQLFILNTHIVSRIKGDPRNFLNYSNKTVWTEIRPALLSKYGDRRSEDILVTQLSTTVQKHNESYDQYHQRISTNLNDLLQHVTLNDNAATVNFKTPYFKNIALKTFCSGINEPYNEYLSHFEIKSIEEALQKCIAYDNHKNQQQYMSFLKSQQNRTPLAKQRPPNQNQLSHNNNRYTSLQPTQPNFVRSPHNAPFRNPEPNFNFASQPNFNNFHPQQNFNSREDNYQRNFPRNAPQENNYPRNVQHRLNKYRNPRNQQNYAPPMSGVQTISTKNHQPMTVTTNGHHFNIASNQIDTSEINIENYDSENYDTEQATEEYVDTNYQDFPLVPPKEQPPPV
ncbi:asparagine-rich protein-like [Diabrotica virgifera virgifera]|uniref:GATA zinc finger domain-containing protein 14-like n=1 Tax=Diabrotica virgifera virgifera TaxID=50390 RepID=A0ABM5L1F0_DIAVI|nr:asparagine-rich protein-like [Diabrotica virgifera virgifera]